MRILLTLLICCFYISSFAQNNTQVNQDRLERSIMELAQFGIDDTGETHRVAFSDADIEGRKWMMGQMQDAGMDVHIDFAGNIIGRRTGTDSQLKPIGFGSHIDAVPNGGNYDGCVGSMGALEVMRTLEENNIKTRHPLEMIIFSNEEGGVMGSRALVGELGPDALRVVNSTGYSMGEGIQRIGGDTTRLADVIRPKGNMKAFLELHIEQGANLERDDLDIGIVEGIVGLQWWDVRIKGFANHAGTTPMNMRQDALLSAAKFILAVNEITNSMEGSQVGTVGRINALPGAPNVIPGEVVLSLEIRDLSEERIYVLYNKMVERAREIGEAMNTEFSFHPLDATAKPAFMDATIKSAIEANCKSLNLSYQYMPSGAGHDAQDMARITPTGMIFVPSKGGISHSPKEFTSAEDMANGASVLLQTILALDKD
ncbi:MAG: Zn-dependent hydrolase [Flavobacteriaceae bacterium]|nr:Zn-dependent hydrolase [Flavobacteriaceae bacterium]